MNLLRTHTALLREVTKLHFFGRRKCRGRRLSTEHRMSEREGEEQTSENLDMWKDQETKGPGEPVWNGCKNTPPTDPTPQCPQVLMAQTLASPTQCHSPPRT